MKGFKEFFNRHKKKVACSIMMAMIAVSTCITAFAEGADVNGSGAGDTLTTGFTTAINTIKSDILSYIAIALPVALAIFGAIIAIKKGISFVRSLIGR